jgi:hypothetical protein
VFPRVEGAKSGIAAPMRRMAKRPHGTGHVYARWGAFKFLHQALGLAVERGWAASHPIVGAARPRRRRHESVSPDPGQQSRHHRPRRRIGAPILLGPIFRPIIGGPIVDAGAWQLVLTVDQSL